jgi:hypothetical protein
MAVSALPSNALYDVQKYLRQKRATGAQVTPQNERAAWSGYFDTMESNSLNERNFALRSQIENERIKLAKEAQKNAEGSAAISGVGQLLSVGGQGAMLLKGTSLGSKIGLGPTTATPSTTTIPGATATVGGSGVPTTEAELTAISGGGGAAPTNTYGATGSVAGGGAASLTAGGTQAMMEGGRGVGLTAAEEASLNAPAIGTETGLLSAASPYLGPAGAGFAAGSTVPHMLGFNKGKGELAAGAAAGGIAGGIIGGFTIGAASTSWSGPGAIVGGVIGAVAGGIAAKVK